MPSTRRPVPVVALLVVLAGCSGIGGSPTDAPGDTPVATDAPTATGTDEPTDAPTATPDAAFPPGTSEDGIENASALVGAHVQALYGVDHRVEATLDANRSDVGMDPLDATVHSGANATYVDQRANASKYGVIPHESFHDGSTLVRKSAQPNGSDRYRYRYDPGEDAIFWTAASGPTEMLQGVLSVGEFEFVGETTADGTTVLRFVADSADEEGIERFDATVEVSSASVVHAVEGTMFVDPDHSPTYRSEFSYDLDQDVGPPTRPEWVDDVPQIVAERTDDGTVLAIENRGEAPLDVGTTIGVQFLDRTSPAVGNVSLPERLGPGEVVYAYAVQTVDGPEVRVTADRPTDTEEYVDLTDREVVVGHDSAGLGIQVRLPPENGTDGSG